ncbi:nuclease-related domain-containing protein [Variovorax sp. RB2P76]|uniref:nuclease-related domain-containing protein n=1 Tax=Variovorax sp. RB2P76 TaxID=3443736 RepID=UPI003F45D47B
MTIALQSNTAATLGVQQLANAFSPTFSHLRILRDLVIPMPEGHAARTARIDAVLVCETGIYLFEIKAWRNAFVYRKKSDQSPPRWFLRLHGCKNVREVKDPAWQGGRKTTQLRSLLPDDLRLQYFVLLPCEGIELEGVMPAAVVTQQDLPYIARLVRNNGRTARTYRLLDAEGIDRTVERLLALQGEAGGVVLQ